MFNNLGNIKESYPTQNILFTEGCVEGFKAETFGFVLDPDTAYTQRVGQLIKGN